MATSNIYTDRLLTYWDASLMGTLPNATQRAEALNAICGDVVAMEAVVEEGSLKSLAFYSKACCMCQCAAAMLVERFRGSLVEDALAFTEEEMRTMLGIEIPAARQTCVFLPLQCLRKLCGQAKDT